MPIAKFQMPDGRIARFEVPEGTSPEQAQSMMEQSLAEMSGPAESQPSTVREQKGKAPPTWDITIDGKQRKAVFDVDAGAYLLNEGGKAMKVMRDRDTKSIFLEELEKPSAAGAAGENFAAGAGKAVSDLGLFGRQVGTLVGNTLGVTSDEDVDRVMAEAADRKQRDKDLMSTGAGLAGNIAGNVGMMVAGGTALKGAGALASRTGQALSETGTAARAGKALQSAGQAAQTAGKAVVMPSTMKSAVAVGAAAGAAQPFEGAFDALGNAVIGGAAGAAGQALATGIGKAITFAANKIKGGAALNEAVEAAAKEAGIDPDALTEPQRVRFAEKVAEQVKMAKVEASTKPEVAARIARAEKLGVPITAAQAEKDIGAQIEQNIALPHSEDLKALRGSQREALTRNIEEMIAGTKSGSGGEELAAAASQKEGMKEFLGTTKQAVKEAYGKAEEEAGETPVATDQVLNFLVENKSFPQLKPAIQKLKDLGAIGVSKEGDLLAMNIPANKLYEVRKVASTLQKSPESAFLGGELKKVVDSAFDESGIDQYAKAASLRRAQSKQFDELEIAKKLVGTKGQQDVMQDTQVMSFLYRQSPERLSQYKQGLVSGNEALLRPIYKADQAARKAGIESARDLKAAALRDLMERSFGDELATGATTVDANSLVSRYYKMGGGKASTADAKWQAILGPKMAERLKTIVQTAEDISSPRGAQSHGSARVNAALSRGLTALFEMVGKTPVVGGPVAAGGASIVKKGKGYLMAKPAAIEKYAEKVRRPAPSGALGVPVAEDEYRQRRQQ